MKTGTIHNDGISIMMTWRASLSSYRWMIVCIKLYCATCKNIWLCLCVNRIGILWKNCTYIKNWLKTFEYDKMFNSVQTNITAESLRNKLLFTFKLRTVPVDSMCYVSMATPFRSACSLHEANKRSSGHFNDAMYYWRVSSEVLRELQALNVCS